MALSVFAADEQSSHDVDTIRWVKLAEAVLRDEGLRGDTEVSILFVDERAMSDLNARFLGRSEPTDVLAFPIDEEPVDGGRSPDSGGTGPGFNPSPEEAPTLLGDVVICPSVAHRNAPGHAGSYDDEVALLVVHGLLHLLGMDHDDPEEAEVMEAKERELLGRHHSGAYSSARVPPSEQVAGEHTTGEPPAGEPATGEPATGEHSAGQHAAGEHAAGEQASGTGGTP